MVRLGRLVAVEVVFLGAGTGAAYGPIQFVLQRGLLRPNALIRVVTRVRRDVVRVGRRRHAVAGVVCQRPRTRTGSIGYQIAVNVVPERFVLLIRRRIGLSDRVTAHVGRQSVVRAALPGRRVAEALRVAQRRHHARQLTIGLVRRVDVSGSSMRNAAGARGTQRIGGGRRSGEVGVGGVRGDFVAIGDDIVELVVIEEFGRSKRPRARRRARRTDGDGIAVEVVRVIGFVTAGVDVGQQVVVRVPALAGNQRRDRALLIDRLGAQLSLRGPARGIGHPVPACPSAREMLESRPIRCTERVVLGEERCADRIGDGRSLDRGIGRVGRVGIDVTDVVDLRQRAVRVVRSRKGRADLEVLAIGATAAHPARACDPVHRPGRVSAGPRPVAVSPHDRVSARVVCRQRHVSEVAIAAVRVRDLIPSRTVRDCSNRCP